MAVLTWSTDIPDLRQPVLVVALDGFVDAGSAAGTAATFLRHRWRAELVASMSRDAFIDYRARRPTVIIDSGEVRRLDWPAIELFTAAVDGPRDAVLLIGSEPDMRWDEFCAAVVEAAGRLGVVAMLGLGAYPAAVPHTRPVRLTTAGTALAGAPVVDAVPVPGYTGPVNIGTALQLALAEVGIPAVGLWAEVPHYISAAPNPSAALALVRAVGTALESTVDTTELEAAAAAHLEQVEEAIAGHDEAQGMVRAFERHADADDDDDDLPTGDEIAGEIERFLRTRPE